MPVTATRKRSTAPVSRLVAPAEPAAAEALRRVPDEAVGLVPGLRLEVHSVAAFDEGPKADR